MTEVTLTIDKEKVYNEVAKTTSYTGAKLTDDTGAYDRIFTTKADRLMLERFWAEACNGATEEFKQFIVSVSSLGDVQSVDLDADYVVEMELSTMFDTNLTGSMQSSLFSYFVNSIVAKWFKFSNKSEAEEYLLIADEMLKNVERIMYSRKRPSVPTDDDNTSTSTATYALNPSQTSLDFTLDSSGNLTPISYTVYCGYTKTVDGVTTTYEGTSTPDVYNIDGEYYILFRFINADGTYYPTSGWRWANNYLLVTVTSDTSYVGIEYILAHNFEGNLSANITEDNIVASTIITIDKESA